MSYLNDALSNVKFHGFLGEMLDFLSVRGHLISNFSHVMGFYGTSLDRYPHLVWRKEIYPSTCWIVVGQTACGKGESLELVSKLFTFPHRLDYLVTPVGRGCPTSGKKFVGMVYDRLHGYENNENRFLAIWEEYVALLIALLIPSNKFNTYLIDLCDGNEINESFKKGNIKLANLHFGCIGHITPKLITKYMRANLIHGGVANRHTIMYVPNSEYRSNPGLYDNNEFAKIQGGLISSLQNGIGRYLVDMTSEAEEKFIAYDRDKFDHPSSNEDVVALMARFTEMCLKIALIISLINGETKVSLASMESACAVMEYSRATLEYLFGDQVASPIQLIKNFIVTNLSVTRTDITHEFAHRLSKDQMDQTLEELLNNNEIQLTQSPRTRGRTANIYTPVAIPAA